MGHPRLFGLTASTVDGRVKPGHGGKSSAAFGNFAGLSQLPLGEEGYNP